MNITVRRTYRITEDNGMTYTYFEYDHPREEPGNHIHVIPDSAVWQRIALYDCSKDDAVEFAIHEALTERPRLLTAKELAASRAQNKVTGHEGAGVPDPHPDFIHEHRYHLDRAVGTPSLYRDITKTPSPTTPRRLA